MHKYDCSVPEWQTFLEAMHSGQQFECDSAIYDYFLGVIPPVNYGRFVNGQRTDFGFAEGTEKIVYFWHQNGRYFGIQSTEINRRLP